MKVSDLFEGFMGFSVNASDDAADLWMKIEEALETKLKAKLSKYDKDLLVPAVEAKHYAEVVLPLLKKGLNRRIPYAATDMHGTLIVALIMREKMQKWIKHSPELRAFARTVADRLDSDRAGRLSDAADFYLGAMKTNAAALRKLAE